MNKTINNEKKFIFLEAEDDFKYIGFAEAFQKLGGDEATCKGLLFAVEKNLPFYVESVDAGYYIGTVVNGEPANTTAKEVKEYIAAEEKGTSEQEVKAVKAEEKGTSEKEYRLESSIQDFCNTRREVKIFKSLKKAIVYARSLNEAYTVEITENNPKIPSWKREELFGRSHYHESGKYANININKIEA